MRGPRGLWTRDQTIKKYEKRDEAREKRKDFRFLSYQQLSSSYLHHHHHCHHRRHRRSRRCRRCRKSKLLLILFLFPPFFSSSPIVSMYVHHRWCDGRTDGRTQSDKKNVASNKRLSIYRCRIKKFFRAHTSLEITSCVRNARKAKKCCLNIEK